MQPLRVAVIGAGGIARLRHLPAFRLAEKEGLAELVAVCDPVPAALAAAADEFRVADRYVDYHDVLARSDVDVVTVATPNSAHEPISIAALEAGKHVLCEKPLALDYAGARRMAAAARRAGKRTGVYFRYRWVPSARYLRELVETGALGEPRHIYMNYFNGALHDPDTPIRWRQTRAEGGGVLADIGSHLLDMAHWLVGDVRRVNATLRTFTEERPTPDGGRQAVDVDDAATLMLEFASGTMGVLNATGVALGRGNHQRIELYGTRGSAIYEIDRADAGGEQLLLCLGADQARYVGLAPAVVPPRHQTNPFTPFLEFLRAIHEQRDPPVTFDDAVRVQEVLEAAELSARSGGWVDLPLPVEASRGA